MTTGFRDDCKALAKIGKVQNVVVAEMLGTSLSRFHAKRHELGIIPFPTKANRVKKVFQQKETSSVLKANRVKKVFQQKETSSVLGNTASAISIISLTPNTDT